MEKKHKNLVYTITASPNISADELLSNILGELRVSEFIFEDHSLQLARISKNLYKAFKEAQKTDVVRGEKTARIFFAKFFDKLKAKGLTIRVQDKNY